MADNTGLRNADRFRERMNANGGCLHITAVLGNIGLADTRKIRGDDCEFFLEFVNQRKPHSRGLRVAVHKYYGWALSRCEVVKLFPFDFRNARRCGFVRFWTDLHFIALR